jgi:hypothetical protein
MNILLGDLVFVSIHTKRHGITGVQGVVTATGEVADKPDAFWIQIAGLSATIYSDEAVIEKGAN